MKTHPLKGFHLVITVLITIFLGLAACGPKTQVILMPDLDGRIGKIAVENPKGSRVLDQAWQSTQVTSYNAQPSEPEVLDESQVKQMFKDALDMQPTPVIYFLLFNNSGTSELTDESTKTLPAILDAINSRHSNDISIIGHTDREGLADRNYKLGYQRARHVADMLIKLGVDPSIIDVASHGEGNPIVETEDGVAEPRNRRVEITVR